jgi:hypothetical protein
MRDEASGAIGDALGMKAGATVSLFGSVLAWDAPVAVMGISVAVLLSALAGALLGVIYGAPLKSRAEVLAATTVNTFIGAAAAVLAPYVPGFAWLGPVPDGVIALLLAFAMRWAIPVVLEVLPGAIRGFLSKFITLPKGSGEGKP